MNIASERHLKAPTVLPPNSRPPNSLSSQIHGFISISIKLLIHEFPPNSLLYD